MKEIVVKEKLKQDFLKQTVIRIDYDYLSDKNITDITDILLDDLGKEGFVVSRDNTHAKVNFTVNIEINNNPYIDELEKENDKFTVFVDSKRNIRIDIMKTCTTLTINYINHESFEILNSLFNTLVSKIRTVRKYIAISRVGLMKKNVYYITDLKYINDYYENGVYNFALIEGMDINSKNSMDTYLYKDYMVNETNSLCRGRMNINNSEQLVYQLVSTFDVYMQDNLIESFDLLVMNSIIFELYQKNLTELFLKKLQSDKQIEGILKI